MCCIPSQANYSICMHKPLLSISVIVTCYLQNAGLTKVPIDGQPKSIVRELEDMARSYIKVICHMRVCSSLFHAPCLSWQALALDFCSLKLSLHFNRATMP